MFVNSGFATFHLSQDFGPFFDSGNFSAEICLPAGLASLWPGISKFRFGFLWGVRLEPLAQLQASWQLPWHIHNFGVWRRLKTEFWKQNVFKNPCVLQNLAISEKPKIRPPKKRDIFAITGGLDKHVFLSRPFLMVIRFFAPPLV